MKYKICLFSIKLEFLSIVAFYNTKLWKNLINTTFWDILKPWNVFHVFWKCRKIGQGCLNFLLLSFSKCNLNDWHKNEVLGPLSPLKSASWNFVPFVKNSKNWGSFITLELYRVNKSDRIFSAECILAKTGTSLQNWWPSFLFFFGSSVVELDHERNLQKIWSLPSRTCKTQNVHLGQKRAWFPPLEEIALQSEAMFYVMWFSPTPWKKYAADDKKGRNSKNHRYQLIVTLGTIA